MRTFVALRGFLALLRTKPELVESDISLFHHLDYRDRWRRDPDGVRRLTLRMIYVRVLNLPATSALSLHFSGGNSAWDLHAHILADLAKHVAGIEYPDRPGATSNGGLTPEEKAEQQAASERRKQAARERARAHNSQTATTVHDDIRRARENARSLEGGANA